MFTETLAVTFAADACVFSKTCHINMLGLGKGEHRRRKSGWYDALLSIWDAATTGWNKEKNSIERQDFVVLLSVLLLLNLYLLPSKPCGHICLPKIGSSFTSTHTHTYTLKRGRREPLLQYQLSPISMIVQKKLGNRDCFKPLNNCCMPGMAD